MRALMLSSVVLLAACASSPPGDVVGGSASWSFEGYQSSGPVFSCSVRDGTVMLSAGARTTGPTDTRLSMGLRGPVDVAPEWDAEIVYAEHQLTAGTTFGEYRFRPLDGCTAHVGTGAGTWEIDLECPVGSGHVTVTGCERP